MIDKSIKTKLGSEFDTILSFMGKTGIDFKDRELRGPYAMTTYYCIYLDIDKMLRFKRDMITYIILHEIGHYKRIAKIGKEQMIKSLSIKKLHEFSNHVIFEEIFADRYARLQYKWLYKELLPINLTQQLENPDNKTKYGIIIKQLFGIIDNDEQKYLDLVESFVVKPTKGKKWSLI